LIAYLLRRVAVMIPIMIIDSVAVFFLVAAEPGNRALALAGPSATPAEVQNIIVQNHLNKPLIVQYWYWLDGVLHLNFGYSPTNGSSVAQQIATRLPITAGLLATAIVIALIMAVPTGVISGIRPGRAFDNLGRLGATLGLAIPNFVLAILLVYVVGVKLKWLPVLGYVSISASPWQWLRHMLLPAVALGTILSVFLIRQLRAGMIDTLDSTYVRAAWARGGRPRRVIGGHALKNASLPALSVFSFAIAGLLGGTAIIENIFNIPGLGSYIVQAIQNVDVYSIEAVTLLLVLTQLVVSLIVDIAYGWLNPKIRVA
jgi:peptide/nickel transport system permease protein